ncbi:MAG TPA: class I SAM-dependent methyltransferase [Solirubrobacteraceae bacterium]|nr:class I SAM-dependent methyltransferase [Solirubrobacteraceae bacterium]
MPKDPMASPRGTYLRRAVAGAVSSPQDAVQKVLEKGAERWERRVRPHPPESAFDDDWERQLHELLGAPWPCPEHAAFDLEWAAANETMAAHGLRVGRQNYGDDDDADPGLARTLWCLVHHLNAVNVVETGVAHGLSSRIMLAALARRQGGKGGGRLWSIDLPAMTIHERRAEIGVAVPEHLRGGWEYLEGSSRRHLPSLLRRVGPIDLFVHDSMHSTRNVRWELKRAWPALRPAGVVLVDDVDFNWGFQQFLQAGTDRTPLVCMSDDGARTFALAKKAGGPPGSAL